MADVVIGMIWAQARDGVIGAAGTVPWHLPEDLAHFRTVTGTGAVVMGRRTWESLPDRFRPLPGRHNVVLSRQAGWRATGADVAHDLQAALHTFLPDGESADGESADGESADGESADGESAERIGVVGGVWVIGGAQVYRAALPHAAVIERTEVELAVDGDAHAPRLGPEWVVTRRDPPTGWHTSRTGLRYRFQRLAPLGVPLRATPGAKPAT